MNINEMEAGREMDALVAEKVMGWTCPLPHNPTDIAWRSEDNVMVSVRHFSTDIAAAWLVVEKMREQFFSIKIIMWDHTPVVAVIGHKRQGHNENFENLYAEAGTAPLAICRAALMAVQET